MDLRALAATVDRIVGETGKVDTASLHAQLFAIHQALRSSDRATISTAQPAVEQALSAVLKGKVALAPPLCVLVGKCYASIFENGDSRNMYTVVGELQQLPVARNASNSTRVCAVTALGEMALALKTRLSSDMPGTITMLSKVLKSTSQPDLRHAAVVALRQTIEGAGEGSSGSGGGGTNSTLAEAAKSFARVWSDRLASIRMLVPQCAVVLAENSENFSAIALEPLLQLAARGVLQDGSPAVIDASASATGAILALSVYASKAVAAAEAQAKIEAARGSSGGAGDEDDDSKSARKASRFGDLAASVSAFKGKDKSSGSRILDFAGCLSYLDTLWHKVSSPDGYVGVTLAVVATLRELDKRGGGNNMESQVAQRLEETLTFLLGRLTKEAWLANDCEPLLVRAAVSQALRGMAQRLPERAQASLVEMLLARLSSKGDAGAGPLQQLSILTELSQLFTALGDACPDPDAAMSAILPLLESSMHPLRFEAALALGALSRTALSLPAKLLELTLDSLDSAHAALIEGATDSSSAPSQERRAATRTRMFPLHGFGATASLLLLALPGHRLGVPPALLERALATAASLIGRQYEPTLESLSGVRLTCTRAGWTLAAALAALRPHSARSSSGKATTSVAAGDQEQPTGLLPALVRLWGRVFAGPSPEVQRTEREPTHELVRLEAALLALNSFIRSSTTFVTDRHHLLQRVVYWLTAVQKLTQTGWVSSPAKPRGQATLLRIRTLLMEAFALLPPSSYEEQHLHLVHMAIEHLTIDPLPNATSVSSPRPTEGGQTPCGWAITRTSLLHSLLHRVDDCLESCSTTHSTAGALLRMEPDSFSWRTLYMMSHATAMSEMEVEAATFGAAAWWSSTTMIARLQARQTSPRGTSSFALHSLPLHGCTLTRAVDAAVSLFCIVFCALPQEHLDGTAKLLAVRARDAEATRSRSQDKCDSAGCPVTYNVITALLGAIRELPSSSSSSTADTDNSWILVLCGAPNSLLCALLSSPISTLRRASAQALGALARKMSPDFTHKMVAMLGGRLKSKEGVTPEGRAGTVFALTCLKRASGGRATINPSLVYKQTNETMQPARNWVLHSWCLVVESVSVGAGFEQYVRSTISLVDAHLLAPVNHAAAAWEPALMGCLVRLLNVLLAALGPEADGYPDLIRRVRTIFNFLRDCCDSRVRAECMQLLEHLVLFAPSAVDRAATLSYILNALQPSSHEALSGGEATRRVRSSAIACLCRLAERDRTVVTRGFCSEKDEDGEKESALSITAVLFRALDDEIGGAGWRAAPVWRGLACPRVLLGSTADDCSRAYLRDMKTAIMEMVDMDGGVEGRPVGWILLFRALLSGGANVSSNAADSDEGGRFGVWAHARTQAAENAVAHGALRWRTRLVALQCARQVLHLLRSADDKGPHFDVTKGREAVTLALQQDGVTVETCPNFLSLHLEELVSMACNAAAASSDDQELYTLQSTGVTLLQDVVSTFVRIPDPDADAGEGVLEQYQAQISSALRRALTNSAACPELLSPACALLATGVQEKLLCDLVMLKRSIKTLMPSPLDDVVTVPSSGSYGMATDAHLHIGRVGTLARLLLAAKVVKCSDGKNDHEAQPAKWQVGLLAVLKPSLSALRQHWISIMHDYLQLQLDDGELGISNDTCSKGTFFGASGATRRIRDKLTDMFSTVAKAVALTFAGDDVDGKTSQFGFVISALLWQLQRSLAQQDDPDSVICLDSLCTMLCSPLLRVEHLAAAACVELIAIVDAAANEQPSLDVRTSAHALLEALTLNGGRGATYLSETFSAGDEAGTELLRAIVRVVCRAFHEELKHQPTGSDNNAQGRVLTLAHAPLVQSMLNLVPPASRAAFYGPLMQLFVRVVNAAAVEDGPSEALSTALQSISCCITAACGTGDDALANTLLHATLNSVGTELEGADEKVLLPALLQLLQTLVLAAPASLMVTGSTVFARFVELWREVLTANSQHKRLAALRSFSSTLQATLRDDESNGGVGRRLLGAIGGHIWVATQMDTSDSETAAEGAKLLLLATTQCPVEQQASMLSSVLLPVLLQLLRHEPGSVTKQVAVQCVTAVLARSPLPFKQAIVTLAPQERSLLETELRAAMAARAQASAGSSSANAPKKLSLKRFTSA